MPAFRRVRFVVLATAILIATLLPASPVRAFASLTATSTINITNLVGTQTDPHIGSNYVSYTNEASDPVSIRYYDLTTSATGTVPNPTPNEDVLSDVSGNTIVFTRFTETGSSIFGYTVGALAATEVAGGNLIRTGATIGANAIAWEDFAAVFAASEVYLNDNGVPVRITNDPAFDLDPALNPTGDVVVFTRCASSAGGCDVYMSKRIAPGVWGAPTAVATAGEEADPDVGGTLAAPVVVYSSVRAGELDIFYVDATGEHRISLPGSAESRPTISNGVIAFESTAGGDTDVLLFDIATGTLYAVATSDLNEQLSDVFVSGTKVQVVFTAAGGAPNGQEVFLFTGTLPAPASPALVTLSPANPVNTVGTSHTVTATVTNAVGGPVANSTIHFTVTGSVDTTGNCTTGADGTCTFTYTGPAFPGADAISGCADANASGTIEAGEPCGEATKAWVLPSSTSGQAHGAGHIADGAGNRIAFGFHAKNGNSGLKAKCQVVDRSADRMIECLDVTSLVISGNEATIYGNATDNGVATTYTIKAKDVADPGKGVDTFSVRTASGYSTSGTLTAGNIQVQP
jgi:hypothetical protein